MRRVGTEAAEAAERGRIGRRAGSKAPGDAHDDEDQRRHAKRLVYGENLDPRLRSRS